MSELSPPQGPALSCAPATPLREALLPPWQRRVLLLLVCATAGIAGGLLLPSGVGALAPWALGGLALLAGLSALWSP